MSSYNALVRFPPPNFRAKTYSITSESRRVEVIRELAQDPLYDRLHANMKLSGMPLFHGHSRESKTVLHNHKRAKADLKKEHTIAAVTQDELNHYKKIITKYIKDEEYTYLQAIKSRVETLHNLSLTIANRFGDLFTIEEMLCSDNPDGENLPEVFCNAVKAAKEFNSQARGGMLTYHAYLKNHGIEYGGPHGALRDPPPLRPKKTLTQIIAKAPKVLVRKLTGL